MVPKSEKSEGLRTRFGLHTNLLGIDPISRIHLNEILNQPEFDGSLRDKCHPKSMTGIYIGIMELLKVFSDKPSREGVSQVNSIKF